RKCPRSGRAGSRRRTWSRSRRSRAGRPRLLRHRRVRLRAGHRLSARLVVEEDEVAVDEGPEVDGPADADLVLLDVVERGQADLRRVRTRRHGEEAMAAGEVDDLA